MRRHYAIGQYYQDVDQISPGKDPCDTIEYVAEEYEPAREHVPHRQPQEAGITYPMSLHSCIERIVILLDI